jgi:hypothetical protein
MNYIVFLAGSQICRVGEVSMVDCDENFLEFYKSVKFGDELYPSEEDKGPIDSLQARFRFGSGGITGYAHEPNPPLELTLIQRVDRIENYLSTVGPIEVKKDPEQLTQ